MKTFCHVGGPILVLLGTLVSVGGSFLMTRFYHPFGPINFARSLRRIIWLVISRQKQTLAKVMAGAPQFANDENKARSLAGVYILFSGLAVQSLGAILVLCDVIRD